MGFKTPFVSDEPEWYKEYLKTDHWKRIQEEYRSSFHTQECFICKNSKFELHHKSYDRLGAEFLTDLVPLCRAHHAKTHKLVKQGIPLWNAHEILKQNTEVWRSG